MHFCLSCVFNLSVLKAGLKALTLKDRTRSLFAGKSSCTVVIQIIFNILCILISLHTGKKDFLKVAELLNVEVIEVKDRIHFLEQYWPRLYLSYVSVKIRQAVCHR